MNLKRDARQVVRTVETMNRFAEKVGPQVTATELGDLNLPADGPETTKGQRVWVHGVLKVAHRQGLLPNVPDVPKDLTIGQAEGLLRALGSPVEELYRLGRDLGARKDQEAWKASRAAVGS